MAFDFCPLSYRNVEEADYKRAVLLVDEQQNLFDFKNVILNQYKFATENFFAF
jgi:hypothetical protein